MTQNLCISDFTIGGVETTNGDPFCRITDNGKGRRYFVSYATYGVESGRMRNHLSQFQGFAKSSGENQMTGRKYNELREVSKLSFDCYLDFLEREDEKSLRNAERHAQ